MRWCRCYEGKFIHKHSILVQHSSRKNAAFNAIFAIQKMFAATLTLTSARSPHPQSPHRHPFTYVTPSSRFICNNKNQISSASESPGAPHRPTERIMKTTVSLRLQELITRTSSVSTALLSTSHSQTSLLLSTFLSLGIPFPLSTR